MAGRPEHVDEVSHGGTWHVQVSGTKTWQLRPNEQGSWPAGTSPRVSGSATGRFQVDVRAGDVLIVNTRLWFHQTEIPSTSGAADQLSLSYARDFFLGGQDPQSCMTNIAGPVSTRDIRRGEWFYREEPVCAVQDIQSRAAVLACDHCAQPLLTEPGAPPSVHLALAGGTVDRGSVLLNRRLEPFPLLPSLRKRRYKPANGSGPTGAVAGVYNTQADERTSAAGPHYCTIACRDAAWSSYGILLRMPVPRTAQLSGREGRRERDGGDVRSAVEICPVPGYGLSFDITARLSAMALQRYQLQIFEAAQRHQRGITHEPLAQYALCVVFGRFLSSVGRRRRCLRPMRMWGTPTTMRGRTLSTCTMRRF